MDLLLSPTTLFSLEDFSHKELFQECTYAWDPLKKLKAYLLGHVQGRIEIDLPATVHLVNKEQIDIGKGCVVEPGAFIQGPCIIGENTTIRHGAYIRGHVVTGEGCVIGHDTEVKDSIFFNRVCAAHFNYVGNSIVGSRVNLGAGVKCANVRLDRKSIAVWIEGRKIDTGLEKLGALIGDGAQLGCNCVTNPGTILGKNTICFPCLNIDGFIPEGAKVKPPYKNIVE